MTKTLAVDKTLGAELAIIAAYVDYSATYIMVHEGTDCVLELSTQADGSLTVDRIRVDTDDREHNIGLVVRLTELVDSLLVDEHRADYSNIKSLKRFLQSLHKLMIEAW